MSSRSIYLVYYSSEKCLLKFVICIAYNINTYDITPLSSAILLNTIAINPFAINGTYNMFVVFIRLTRNG